MSSKRHREFLLKEDDISEFLMADNSDDEDGLFLDELDLTFSAQDIDAGMSTVEIQGSGNKINVVYPEVVVKYNKNIGGVDLMDQKKLCYEVDWKAKIKYYLRLFFDILGIVINNSYIIYCKLHEAKYVEGTELVSLEFRQVVARSLIGSFSSRQRAFYLQLSCQQNESLTL